MKTLAALSFWAFLSSTAQAVDSVPEASPGTLKAMIDSGREWRDLYAQERMATAAEQTVYLSYVSLFAAVLAVVLAWRANGWNKKTFWIENRAYVVPGPIEFTFVDEPNFVGEHSLRDIRIKWTNKGRTTAMDCTYRLELDILPAATAMQRVPAFDQPAKEFVGHTFVMTADEPLYLGTLQMGREEVNQWIAGSVTPVLYCRIDYTDAAGERQFTETCSLMHHRIIDDHYMVHFQRHPLHNASS
ncbi:hypothetical protein GOB17_33735 [Sinorhizobium meliloti]|uniref:hypothetical protein n=1 Tax=Rhizobium meliloti TaxID=382 RepID=UPI00299EF737|nr:hypothetical protein [Sinorhizobium meliloti]